MKISYNWLKQYLDLDPDYNKIAGILTTIGLEVEGVDRFESVKGGLKGVVIGEVLTREKHPNADSLSLTTVDVGNGVHLPIVCGAPNVAAGQKVAVAMVGSTLYSKNGELVIKKAKIRGEVSEGMICAEDELGLGDSHDGIMVLDHNSVPGTPAAEYFKVTHDVVFEIGLTPNRIDAASHFGVARDLAAYMNQFGQHTLTKPSIDQFSVDNERNIINVKVENSDSCKRYSGLTISDVKIAPSPDWLKNYLSAIGLKPINNIVDITNYVLHEIGQPLHAFDASKIEGREIVVKCLPQGTPFKTLDDITHTLNADDLMICDTKKGMCMGGVFGGIDSGVSDSTKEIFLESAYFDPTAIRKTAKRHGLSTDSSFRFERGVDPQNTVFALKRAAVLIREIAGGNISSNIIEHYPKPIPTAKVNFTFHNLDRLIGHKIPKDKAMNILQSLDFIAIEDSGNELILEVPSYRVDVTREADVIEEILRIFGYNTIEMSNDVFSTLNYTQKPDIESLREMTSDLISSMGFSEMMSNSLQKVDYYETEKFYSSEKCVKIINALSFDLSVLRQSLLFGVLEAVTYNWNRKNPDLKLYEFGMCYDFTPDANAEGLKKYHEHEELVIAITGHTEQQNWNVEAKKSDFYQLKSFVEKVIHRIGVDYSAFTVDENTSSIYEYAITYRIGDKKLIDIGSLSHNLLSLFDLKQPVFTATLDWLALVNLTSNGKVRYEEMSKFPKVRRDLALLLDKSVKFDAIRKLAFKVEPKLIKEVSIFDFYQGKGIDPDKKSYAVSYQLLDESKTLTDKQIDKTMKRLVEAYKEELGASIR